MIEIRPAANRFRTDQAGITTFHSFSAGPHYDPGNVAFGPIVGLDEHLVAPGAGFDWHGHRSVHIVSWVLDGVLRHEDSNGEERFVPPGMFLVQSTGDGIRHRETNASDIEPLRFVQIAIVDEDEPSTRVLAPPAAVAGCEITLGHADTAVGGGPHDALAFVTHGLFHTGSVDRMQTGATMRVGGGDAGFPQGDGELLVVTFAR